MARGSAVVLTTMLLACGPPARRPVTAADGVDDPARGPGARVGARAVTPEAVCARILELKAARCELAASYELTEAECREDLRRSLDDRGDEARQATTAASRCLLDNQSCEAIGQCLASLNEHHDEQDGSPTRFRACGDVDEYAPVGRPPAEWARRRGAGAARYSAVTSSKDEPIEVCGIPAEMEWLLAATCDDGSRPFRSYDHAHAARSGNVGSGGACGSIIDLYEVPCPEGTYQIYIDAYVCPLPDEAAP